MRVLLANQNPKLSQWTMMYNSIARTRGAYNETWVVRVVIESQGPGILSGYYECGLYMARGYFYWKIEEK